MKVHRGSYTNMLCHFSKLEIQPPNTQRKQYFHLETKRHSLSLTGTVLSSPLQLPHSVRVCVCGALAGEVAGVNQIKRYLSRSVSMLFGCRKWKI
jgi:hypothetical protein